jgi:hypothetical protein
MGLKETGRKCPMAGCYELDNNFQFHKMREMS